MHQLIEIEGNKCIIVAKKVKPLDYTPEAMKAEYDVDYAIIIKDAMYPPPGEEKIVSH